MSMPDEEEEDIIYDKTKGDSPVNLKDILKRKNTYIFILNRGGEKTRVSGEVLFTPTEYDVTLNNPSEMHREGRRTRSREIVNLMDIEKVINLPGIKEHGIPYQKISGGNKKSRRNKIRKSRKNLKKRTMRRK
jgi:hypothetical protein